MANILLINVTKPVTRTSEGELEIIGTGFTGASKIHFIDPAGKKFTAKSFNVINDEMVTCVCPVFSESGLAKVYVTVNGVDSAANKATQLSSNSRTIAITEAVRTYQCNLPREFENEFQVLPLGYMTDD